MTGPPPHVPERRCLGCRVVRPRRELVRLVLEATASPAAVEVDPRGRRPGRGAYLCRDSAARCLAEARRRRAFARAFRVSADAVSLATLEAQLSSLSAAPAAPLGGPVGPASRPDRRSRTADAAVRGDRFAQAGPSPIPEVSSSQR